ncbi:hypothetical protein ACHAXR_006902 [Thalassiosira sp. AJA248-18]
MVSGLASSIRSTTESATFDLAGHDAASIRTVINDAFSHPLSLDADIGMIRITFAVGAGKLSRQKYDAKAGLAVTGSLKQLDYVEDRGASCILECGGCFKSQHDTGKNLFTVVVFPKVFLGEGDDSNGGGRYGNQTVDEDDEPLVPTNSPGYKLAVCSQQTFRNLLTTYCPTYLEKRECLQCLEGLLQVEQAIEKKMMNGHPLDSAEQTFYDESSDLKEKYAHTQKESSKHVEEGRLTSDERNVLVSLNEKRIETLMKEDSSASVAEKLKKALARKQQLQTLSDEVLSMNSTSYPPPLRYESQITTLRKKLLPLVALEESSRGRLLTLSETRSLTDKEEMESEISRLEEASCGWFEDEEIFQERLSRSREKFDSKFSRSKRSGGKAAIRSVGKGGIGGANAVNKWILPGEKPKSAWGSTGKKKLKGKGGAIFAAMMMDSSSEEEESDSDDESVENNNTLEVKSYATQKKQHPAAANVMTSKKAQSSTAKKPIKSNSTEKETSEANQPAEGSMPQSKKNKKKKKGGKSKKKKIKPSDDIQEVDELTESKKEPSVIDTPSTVSDSLLQFWQSFLLPFIMAVVSLLVSLVTSMFAGKNSKKGGKKKR